MCPSVRPSVYKVFQQEIILTSFDEIRLNKQRQTTIRSSLHHHPKCALAKSREILIKMVAFTMLK
jgi:hypothetical protein